MKIDINSPNVTELPVKFKSPAAPEDVTLVRVWAGKCYHRQVLVDEKKAEVECAACHEKLNPMWVLSMLASHESRWHEAGKRYQDEMKRLTERSSTKCNHCGKMTRISNR